MKYLPALLLLLACSTKKPESASTPSDSLSSDDIQAPGRAAAMLASSALDGYLVRNGVDLPDSTNFFLLGSAEVLDQYFTAEGAQAGSPDFIINYVVGIACRPDPRQTTIVMDSVITGESSLDVFITLRRGETVQKSTKSARLFSIERREGYPVVQFYVNGKKDKALVLVGI